MARPRTVVILLGVVAAAAVAALRHRAVASGREVPGRLLIGHVGAYDLQSRFLLQPAGSRSRPVGRIPGRAPGSFERTPAGSRCLARIALSIDRLLIWS